MIVRTIEPHKLSNLRKIEQFYFTLHPIRQYGDSRFRPDYQKAVTLYYSGGFKQKWEAYKFFKAILSGHIRKFKYKFDLLVKVIDILITQLKLTESNDSVAELKSWVKELSNLTEMTDSAVYKIRSLEIQSEFTLFDGDVNTALKILEEAKELAVRHKLFQLMDNIDVTRNYIKDQGDWNSLIETSQNPYTKLKLTKIDEYITSINEMSVF